jgi:hypothetical protein
MKVLFLPGRWQNELEFGAYDFRRDIRSVLRERGHDVVSVRYSVADQQRDTKALSEAALSSLQADVSSAWTGLGDSAVEKKVIVAYSLGASLALMQSAALRPDALVIVDGGLLPSTQRTLTPRLDAGDVPALGFSVIESPAWHPRLRRLLSLWEKGQAPPPIGTNFERLDDTQAHYLRYCTYKSFPGRVVDEIQQAAIDPEVDQAVRDIGCPILIVASLSSGASGDRAIAMAARHRWKSLTLETVQNASHLEMICGEQMIPYWERVGDWLEVNTG